jgi:D-alanyl-lipoteichoic acid acyltransferase DltB (MBOAT superfamily)
MTLSDIFVYNSESPLLFGQYLFLGIFTVVYLGFSLIHKEIRIRNIYLLIFSLFFYYKCSGLYFFLLLFSTLVDYGLGWGIFHASSKWKKKLYMIISLIVNLGVLSYFKYSYYYTDLLNYAFGTNFQAVNYLHIFANGTFGTDFDVFDIFLPVGISFYTFQTLSYSIDIYRNKLKPTDNVLDFAFFVSFFPQLVAGPIVRAADFIPQIKKPFHLTNAQFGLAVYLIIAGLFKKVFISDYISINFVDRVFENPELYTGFMNLFAVYGYSIQIYCDFSGYSDMAIGLAALLGFQLPINFMSPYKATSITDFWRRWHISLSSWLKDYLYISLGGNRKGKIRTYANLMITMLLGGLWHGAATKFIIWGGLHGLGLAIHKIWERYTNFSFGKFQKFLSILITFHFVAFCWMYFRAPDMDTVGTMLQRIFTDFNWTGIGERVFGYWRAFFLIILGFILHLLPSNLKYRWQQMFVDTHLITKVLIAVIVIFVAYQSSSSDVQPFIYFQF